MAAIAYGHEADHDLRSRCLLIPQHSPMIEMVGRDGQSPEEIGVDRESAARLVSEASARAARSGIAWEKAEIALRPAPKLIELLRRSREVSAREPAAE